MKIQTQLPVCLAFLFIVLTACTNNGDTEPPEEEQDPPEQAEEQPNDEEQQRALELLDASITAMADLDSYEVTMLAEQSNRRNINTAEITTESTQTLTQEPFSYYETATVTHSEQEGNGEESSTLETYYNENEGLFVHEPTLDIWMQLPSETEESLQQLQQFNQENQFDLLLEQINENTIELDETDGVYTIEMSGDIEGLDSAGEVLMNSLQGSFSLMMEDLASLLTIEELQFEVLIDTETMYMESFTTQINMVIAPEQSTHISAEQVLELTYDQYNEVDEITIPDHIIEEAEQLEIDTEAFQNFEDSLDDDV